MAGVGAKFVPDALLRVFGPATPTRIARWTGMRPTTVYAALKRMSGRGHSEQRPNPADGRSYQVALNPAGAAAHLHAAGPFLEVMARVSAALQPDEHAERIALQRLDSALRATAGLDARPYRLAARDNQQALQLPYAGDPLTPAQESAVRAYIDFIRTQPAGRH